MPTPLNSLCELSSKIEDLLIEEGVTLHLNRKMRRYIKPLPTDEK